MFEGIKILDGKNIINFESLSKNEKGQYLLKGVENLAIYLKDGASYTEKVQVEANDNDVLILLTDAKGNEIEMILLSLSEMLLKNQEEIPLFEVFNGDEKIVSFQSIDDLEAAAAGNQTVTSSQTSDFGEDSNIVENEIGTSGQNLDGFTANPLFDITDPTYNENITFSGDLSSQLTEDFVQEGSSILSGVISNDDPNYGQIPFIPQTTTTEYGVFNLDENGNWTYELFTEKVQFLKAEEILGESFLVELLGRDTTTTVSVNVTGINDAPEIIIRSENDIEDLYEINEDSELRVSFLVDDAENDTVTTTVSAINGTAVIQDGQIIYTPDANFNGQGSVTITLDDGNGGITTKTLNVNILSVNDKPEPKAVNEQLTEESLEDLPLSSSSSKDTTFNGKLEATDPDSDVLSFTKTGNLGLTISSTNTKFLAAINPATEDLDYVKSVLLEIVKIPEIDFALNNSLNSVKLNVTELIAQFNNASDIQTALSIIMKALGVNNASLVPTENGVDLVIQDASPLEKEGLLNLTIEQDGNYTVTSPLFNHLSVDDSVSISFDYAVSDDSITSIENANLNISGSNDAPEIEGVYPANSWSLTAAGVSKELLESFLGESLVNDESTPHQGSAVAITLEVKAGETIKFNWDFDDMLESANSKSANDFSFVLINGTLTILEDVFDTNSNGNKIFSHTFTDAGQYTITFGVVNSRDTFYDSELHLEHISGGKIISTEIIGKVLDMKVLSSDKLTVNENIELGTIIGGLKASDSDILDNLTYSLVNPSDKFEVDPSTGEIKVISELDFETQDKYEIEIRVSDGNGGVSTKTIEIVINDILEVKAINTQINEEDLLDEMLVSGSKTDTTYKGVIDNINDDNVVYSRAGKIGLAISTSDAKLVAALNPVTADLDYVKSILKEIIEIPEVTLALTNNLNSVPNMDINTLLTQFQGASDISTALGLVTNALGVLGVSLVPNAGGITLLIEDASALEAEGLLNVIVNQDGTYIVTSPLFNHLNVDDSVKISFDYSANNGVETKTQTVTLEVNGTNDFPELRFYGNENLLTNGSFENVVLTENWEFLKSDDVPGWQTDNLIETWGPNGPGKASHGDNLIELDSDSGLDSISQELNLKAGKYLLEFDAANRGNIDSTNDFKVIFNGQEIIITSDMMKNNSEWTTFSFELDVPSDGNYDIKFEELNNANDGLGLGTLLDNIQLFASSGNKILTIGEDPDINDSGVVDMVALLSNTQNLQNYELDEINLLQDNHILSNITIEDVLSITDADNTLEITGDIGDKLLLNLGSEISDSSEIVSGDTKWHKDTSASTSTEEVYIGKSSTDETITLLINGINVEDV